MPSDRIRFQLNGAPVEVPPHLPGTTTLLRFLRDHLHLTGTKEGCAEGDCGACTVAVREGSTWRAVDACLLFLPMVHGGEVWTVEGLRDRSQAMADPEAGHHPVQQALVETRGSQCGYCTPGIVMSLFEACYRQDISPGDLAEVDAQLAGNLCRCTGYRPIREAGVKVAGLRPQDRFLQALQGPEARDRSLEVEGGGQTYLQPGSLPALWEARRRHPDAVLVAGGTDLGLRVTKDHRHFSAVIGLEAVPELQALERTEEGWRVGAGVSLTRLSEAVGPSLPALQKMLGVFGARQVRNRGTVGGNLCNASPIGDLAPVLLALGATLRLAGPSGVQDIEIDRFFLSYRKTALAPDQVLLSVDLPLPQGSARCASYKVSKRRELDISAVSAGFYLDLEAGAVRQVRLAFGGVAATPVRARGAEAALLGRPWDPSSLQAALDRLPEDITPISDQRGSATYRMKLARNLLRGFFLESFKEERTAALHRPVSTVLPPPLTEGSANQEVRS